MKQPLPIGTSDFRKLRRAGQRYVDKSGLITDVLRASAETLLLPRPRRFGKTVSAQPTPSTVNLQPLPKSAPRRCVMTTRTTRWTPESAAAVLAEQ